MSDVDHFMLGGPVDHAWPFNLESSGSQWPDDADLACLYSFGMRTKLGFSIITSIDPDIFLIDEVLSTGDLPFTQKAQERIMACIAKSKVLFVASHSADIMRMFCNRAMWMDKGQLIRDGDFDEVWHAYYSKLHSG